MYIKTQKSFYLHVWVRRTAFSKVTCEILNVFYMKIAFLKVLLCSSLIDWEINWISLFSGKIIVFIKELSSSYN